MNNQPNEQDCILHELEIYQDSILLDGKRLKGITGLKFEYDSNAGISPFHKVSISMLVDLKSSKGSADTFGNN